MRITLYTKLSKQADFEKLQQTLKTLSDPVEYIVNKYNVTKQTAKKFMDEYNGKSIKSGAKKEDSERVYLEKFLEESKKALEENRGSRVQTFFNICEKIDKMSVSLLSLMLNKYTGKVVSQTAPKTILVSAVKKLFQYNHYELINGALPQERVRRDLDILVKQVTE